MQKINLNSIAKEFGTPVYIYNGDVIVSQLNKLKKLTHDQGEVFYSLKANPNIAIAQLLCLHGANAEVSSLAELEIALAAGFSSHNIIFVGPCKSDEEIIKALEHDIYALVCESFNEIHRIETIATFFNKTVNVLLRINPDFCIESAPLKMGGAPSQFGIDIKQIDQQQAIQQYNHVKLIGIHVYNGTRVLNAVDLAKNIGQIFLLAEKLSEKWGIRFEALDLGGGFGIPYFDQETQLDIEILTNLVAPQFEEFKRKYPHTRLMIESGRFLVAESGYFVSQIKDIKTSHGENFLVTDGGMNCHMAATGIGSFIRRNFPIIAPGREAEDKTEHYNITGPLCTPGDLIGKKVAMPKMNIHDLIAICNSGAYGPSASPVLFLSHGHPAEVLIWENNAHLIRRRDITADMIRNQFKLFEEGNTNAKRSAHSCDS
jgi:diaminopimelate decarboxylase